MNINIRIADPAQDFQRVAELLSANEPETTHADELIGEYHLEMGGRILRHAVAVNEQGEIVGFSFAGHYPSMEANQYYADVIVDPAHRQQQIGPQLWDELAGYFQAQGAVQLLCDVREGNPAYLEFAQNRGFKILHHLLRATLDLAQFQDSRFEHLAATLEADGIHLTTFADVAQTEENIRQLYDINGIAALDDPATDGGYVNYENWKKVILGASWFQPAGQIIALDGDKFVALSAITYNAEENRGSTLISGVDPAYRNRKIMQALKYQAIQYARSFGASEVATELAAINEPMRAINRKFGFVEGPGYFEMAMSMPKLERITPLVAVADVLKSVEFFENVLGFKAMQQSKIYAYIQRDEVAIRLQNAGDGVGQQACYIDVKGVDALYAELKPALDKLPAGRVRAPFDQAYGQREFHVIDLDSLLIFFGESIDDENRPND